MIPLIKHTFINEGSTRRALAEFVLNAGQLSMGPKCADFERAFSLYQGRRFASLYNSGASSNLALLQALKNMGKLDQGSKVGFSALTWATNTMPIIQLGMVPVPIDCDPSTLNVMSSGLRERLEKVPLDALFLTNALGFVGDVDLISDICRSENVILIEDNCEALGTEMNGVKAGNFGLASTFSFFVAHHMSTIEGGMVCTDDQELAEMVTMVRANGWDRNLDEVRRRLLRGRHGGITDFEAKYTFYELAFNMRPTEITGFLGLEQLKHIEKVVHLREKNYLALEESSSRNPDLLPLRRNHISRLSNFAFPVICRTPELKERYKGLFGSSQIEIRPIIAGNIQAQPFYKKYVKETYPLPGTEMISKNGFYCGNNPELDDVEIETIKRCLAGISSIR